ncbi:hypothetical protein Lal_00022763 [Lupinus albus]|nr:hypothetical protein Lal_00022763 [Lupinus albus]
MARGHDKGKSFLMPKSSQGKQELRVGTYDAENTKKELASAIIMHDYPLSIVDLVGFRRKSGYYLIYVDFKQSKDGYHSSDPRLGERFSFERERITWEGEILDYTRRFSPERELPRLGEKWQTGAVDTLRSSPTRESLA